MWNDPLRRTLPLTVSLVLVGLAVASPARAQQRLGDEFQINTYTTSRQRVPEVTSDASGDFVVVWDSDDQDGNGSGVFGQRFDASGNPLGEEFQINTYRRGNQRRSSIASAADGRFVVIWEQFLSGNGIFGRRFDAAGNTIGAEFQVPPGPGPSPGNPAVASHSDGSFVVVWDDTDGSSRGIVGQRFDDEGNPVGEPFQVNSYWTGDQSGAEARSDEDGNFVVVWSSADYGADSIFGQRYDASGIALGEEFRVSRNSTIDEGSPEVAFAGDGSFVVVWRGPDEDQDGILGQRFDASGYPVGWEFRVNTYTSGDQESPDISADSEGNFIVVWSSVDQDGDDRGIFGQALAPDGTPRGDEFQISSYTTGDQELPVVASDASGNFVVAWDSDDQDGDDRGIFGQRFAGPGLALSVDGSCPGSVTVEVSSAPPSSEVALIAAANTNGFVKGGALCPGTQFEVGEPFQLPPAFVIVDANGNGSTSMNLAANRCHLQALAFATCETSNVVEVP